MSLTVFTFLQIVSGKLSPITTPVSPHSLY
jgi:hypothetical protein